MKILIAEDDAISRRILEAALSKWGFDVVSVTDGIRALEVLQQQDAPRLAILDWVMPGLEGIDVCRKLRGDKNDDDLYTYLILLTSKDSKQHVVDGMEAGADDYIVKPFDQQELRVRVRAGQRIVRLQSELFEAKQELLHQSKTDPLTGVLNRRAIFDQIKIEINRARREKKSLSLSMLDLDHFKKINDTYGHPAGDEVLKETVRRIGSVLREYDHIGRFGGEEFVVLIPGLDSRHALKTGERIQSAINSRTFPGNHAGITVTISQGMVTGTGSHNPEALIEAADNALYQAKKNGRNRIEQAFLQEE